MSLLDDMNADVVAYKPERAGESVEGEIVSLDVTSSEFTDEAIPVIVLKQDDAVYRSVRGYHSVLRARLTEAVPRVGDRLAIKYEGRKQNRKGTGSYHNYTVRLARGSSAPTDAGADVAPF